VLLFSATFPGNVVNYANQFSPDANQILLEQNQLTVAGIKQMVSAAPHCTFVCLFPVKTLLFNLQQSAKG